jgi:hypothetical protein
MAEALLTLPGDCDEGVSRRLLRAADFALGTTKVLLGRLMKVAEGNDGIRYWVPVQVATRNFPVALFKDRFVSLPNQQQAPPPVRRARDRIIPYDLVAPDRLPQGVQLPRRLRQEACDYLCEQEQHDAEQCDQQQAKQALTTARKAYLRSRGALSPEELLVLQRKVDAADVRIEAATCRMDALKAMRNRVEENMVIAKTYADEQQAHGLDGADVMEQAFAREALKLAEGKMALLAEERDAVLEKIDLLQCNLRELTRLRRREANACEAAKDKDRRVREEVGDADCLGPSAREQIAALRRKLGMVQNQQEAVRAAKLKAESDVFMYQQRINAFRAEYRNFVGVQKPEYPGPPTLQLRGGALSQLQRLEKAAWESEAEAEAAFEQLTDANGALASAKARPGGVGSAGVALAQKLLVATRTYSNAKAKADRAQRALQSRRFGTGAASAQDREEQRHEHAFDAIMNDGERRQAFAFAADQNRVNEKGLVLAKKRIASLTSQLAALAAELPRMKARLALLYKSVGSTPGDEQLGRPSAPVEDFSAVKFQKKYSEYLENRDAHAVGYIFDGAVLQLDRSQAIVEARIVYSQGKGLWQAGQLMYEGHLASNVPSGDGVLLQVGDGENEADRSADRWRGRWQAGQFTEGWHEQEAPGGKRTLACGRFTTPSSSRRHSRLPMIGALMHDFAGPQLQDGFTVTYTIGANNIVSNLEIKAKGTGATVEGSSMSSGTYKARYNNETFETSVRENHRRVAYGNESRQNFLTAPFYIWQFPIKANSKVPEIYVQVGQLEDLEMGVARLGSYTGKNYQKDKRYVQGTIKAGFQALLPRADQQTVGALSSDYRQDAKDRSQKDGRADGDGEYLGEDAGTYTGQLRFGVPHGLGQRIGSKRGLWGRFFSGWFDRGLKRAPGTAGWLRSWFSTSNYYYWGSQLRDPTDHKATYAFGLGHGNTGRFAAGPDSPFEYVGKSHKPEWSRAHPKEAGACNCVAVASSRLASEARRMTGYNAEELPPLPGAIAADCQPHQKAYDIAAAKTHETAAAAAMQEEARRAAMGKRTDVDAKDEDGDEEDGEEDGEEDADRGEGDEADREELGGGAAVTTKALQGGGAKSKAAASPAVKWQRQLHRHIRRLELKAKAVSTLAHREAVWKRGFYLSRKMLTARSKYPKTRCLRKPARMLANLLSSTCSRHESLNDNVKDLCIWLINEF